MIRIFRRLGSRFFHSDRVNQNIAEELNRQKILNKWLFRGVFATAAASSVVICMRSVNCILYDVVLSGMRCFLDGETAHKLSIAAARLGLSPVDYSIDPPILYNNIGNLKIFNPIGMAAGYDKHAEAPLELLRLGFGFVEVGTVLPLPQEGNPKPRVFRLEKDRSIINSYGFNSVGMEKAVDNIKRARSKQAQDPLTKDSIIGISIGKNKTGEIISDTTKCLSGIGMYADYIVINISSPNTPNLRDNQRREPLIKLVREAKRALEKLDMDMKGDGLKYINTTGNKPLLFVKISPDVTKEQLSDIAHVIMEYKIDGVILTNTTMSRIGISEQELDKIGNPGGGLSGPTLKKLSKELVFEMYKLTNGGIPIIASGGITNPNDALEMIEAGASACQIYTAFLLHIPDALVVDLQMKGWIHYFIRGLLLPGRRVSKFSVREVDAIKGHKIRHIYEGPKLPSLMKKGLARLLYKKGYTSLGQAIGAAHRE